MASDEDIVIKSAEFTLEDTYQYLKNIKNKRVQNVKKLMSIINNNEIKSIGPNITPEEIQQKRLKFVYSLGKLVAQEQPQDLPISNTLDVCNNALKELEDEVRAMEELDKITDEEIVELEKDIEYLEKKKKAFEQMQTPSNESTTNYEAEMIVTKCMFQEVKKDLANVVDLLFPNNKGFQDLLCVLTRALSKGGDDLYITVAPDILDFVNFLEEADIIQFHPHDKTKIKLRNLL